MKAFQLALICISVGIVAYTFTVGINHGWNLFPIFFRDMAAMTWPGQFDFDFACFLLLSGSWVAWRNHFSPGSIALGLIATVGGSLFLAPYLLFVTFQAKGDMGVVLLGEKRSAA